jgi:hypothetical protein
LEWTDVSEGCTAFIMTAIIIALLKKAARTSEPEKNQNAHGKIKSVYKLRLKSHKATKRSLGKP